METTVVDELEKYNKNKSEYIKNLLEKKRKLFRPLVESGQVIKH